MYEEFLVDVPNAKNGIWKIEKFIVERQDYRSMFNGRGIPIGKEFTRLMRGNQVVMSDTPAEIRDHREFIDRANGNVLIAGLGIGMVLQAVAKKENVLHVTVVEKSKEVIEMVWNHYKEKFGDKIEIINADILKWKSDKNVVYDVSWYDIWEDICGDNLEEMKKLHRRFAKKTKWQGSWCRDLCLCSRRNNRKFF